MVLPFFFPFQLLGWKNKINYFSYPSFFLLEYPLHQHFPPAKLMLHQPFKHKEQSLCCHLRAESAQPAGEDVALCSPPCTHHSLGNMCYFFLYMGIYSFFLLLNEGRFGLRAKCHLQHPLEQCVRWICCKTHYFMEIFLSNTVVPENNLINHR